METVIRRSLRVVLWLLLFGLGLRSASLGADAASEVGGSAVWKYLDDGSEPEAAWRRSGFDDSKWRSGKAPLGYGDTRLKTLVRFGNDAVHKHVTTWFRSSFE